MRREVFVLECQGADGADFNALSALVAHRFDKRFVLEGGYHSLEAPSGKTNGSDALLLLAYPCASAAENTFVGVVDKKRATFIDGKVSFNFSESLRLEFYAKVLCNFLELAGAVF